MNRFSKWMVTPPSNMKINKKKITTVILAFLIIQSSAFACSAFLLKGDKYQIIGFNENWKHLPGMVVVNKRGLVKHNLSWADLVAVQLAVPKMSWTSKYGSVTFNAFGIDAPCYGMNEASLFLVELFLDKTYSLPDTSRPRMFWAQWIQYQLDNYATVEEVVQHLPEAPLIDWWPHFPGSHFFVTDAKGRTAAIEFIEGKPVVSNAERMPQPILCNGPYQQELAALGRFKTFSGERPFDYSTNSWDSRFARIAHRLNEYRPETAPPLEYAWKLLDEVYAGTRQLVVDAHIRTLYFRSQACNSIKFISLADCDFSTNSPIGFIDLHINFKDDVVPQLAAWTPKINQAYVLAGFPAGYEQEDFYRSEDWRNLQKNLLNYSEQLQRQTKNLCTMNDRPSTKKLSDFPMLKGPYLDQQPPRLKAEPFAPAVLSVPGKNHHTLSFSTDGKELYFSCYPERVTLVMRQVNGIWQPPESTLVEGWEAIFTPDGKSLIFGDGDLWIMHRTAFGWNQAEKIKGAVNSSSYDYYASVANDSTLYFSRIVDDRARILRARPSGDRYDSVEELEAAVNGTEAYHPFVAPDGSYLLFNSRNRTSGYGGADIYVSFRQPDGTFGTPINLGPSVNSADFDICPVVTPDGKYLFFTRFGKDSNGNMTGTPYWVSARVIEEVHCRAKP